MSHPQRETDSDRSSDGFHARLVLVLPFVGLTLSGMAGLVYEVVWSRAVVALFGSVLPATGTLLAIFMAGLGLGSALGARWAARSRRPLLVFGVVEVLVGALALATPVLLRLAAPLVRGLDVHLPDSLALLVPAALSVLVLGPIVVLLGTTFPLFLKHAARSRRDVGRISGRVYGVNTAGAVLGTLAAGFLLLPMLGIQASLVVAAVTDLLVGAGCVVLGRGIAAETAGTTGPQPGEHRQPSETLAIVVALLGGAAALILEVAWFRALMLMFGSSVYSLSLMLAAFLVGLVSGSLVLARRSDSAPDTLALLARYHLLIAFSATMVTVIVQLVPGLYIPLLRISGGNFVVLAGGTLAILVPVLLVPTTLMGAALPVAIRLACGTQPEASAGPAGRVYAASSLGSSAGALAAGFLFVPFWGLRGAVLSAVVLSLIAAVACSRKATTADARKLVLQTSALIGVIWLVWLAGALPWDWRLLTAGYYAYGHLYSEDLAAADGPMLRRVVLKQRYPFTGIAPVDPGSRVGPSQGPAAPGEERLLSWEEGRYAQVAVAEEGSVRSLLINGKADASNGQGDMRTQLLLGHLPTLLASRDPAGSAMVIGLGSGITAGAVASWPYTQIQVAEIEPAVVRASAWFTAENNDVLADPRVVLRTDDARRVLERSSGGLSLITSEPSNLWMSGVSHLFTEEFFALAAERLGEHGVLCQWLHLYQVGADDVRILLHTVARAFPHQLVLIDGSDLLLVASRSPLVLDPEIWQRRLQTSPQAVTALVSSGVTSAAVLARGFVAGECGIGRWVEGAGLHTDDHPIIEFSAARHMASDLSAPIRSSLVRTAERCGPIPLGTAGQVGG